MKSPLGTLLRPRAQTRPPVPLAGAASRRSLSYNLNTGRGDPQTHLRQYGASGTIFGIVSLLAESAATPVWRLYKTAPVDGRRRYATGDKGTDQRVEIVQHAAIKLWNSPNDWHSGFEFREGSQQHAELTGETFWVLDMEAGFPTSMWYVRPDRMEPVPDPDEYLTGWIYTGPDGTHTPLKTNEVILEKRPDPLDPYRGAGPVASILPNIQQQRYATEYQRNLFLNGADPGGIITVPNKLTDPQFDELVDRWRESHRGVSRAGHVGVLEAGAVWTPNAHSNKDMEYGQLRLANRDELREAWRIHKTMMGTSDDVNRANAQTAQEVFVGWQTIPRLNRRRDTLNNKLLPRFGTTGVGVEFDYDDPSPENAEAAANELTQKATAFQTLVNSGVDPHAAAEVVGLPDMDMVETATQAPALPPSWVPELPPGQAAAAQARAREVIRMAAAPPPADGRQAPPQQLKDVDTQWKAAVALLVTAWIAAVTPAWIDALTTQVHDRVAADNILGLAALTLDTAAATTLVLDHAAPYAQAAAQQAADEAAAAGHPATPATAPTRTDLETIATTAVALLAAQIALSAGREATRLASGTDPDPAQVARQVRQFLQTQSDAQVTAMACGVMSAAQNTARLATITAGPRAPIVATEMHDKNSCAPCDAIDGHVFGYSDDPDAVAAAQAAYPAGGYALCEGGLRCRGTLYADYTGRLTGKNTARVRPQGKDAAAKVFEQVASDYPPAATAWMHHATWSGPTLVPLDRVQPVLKWMDGASPAHVQDFVRKRQSGKKLKPVILVKTPGDPLLLLVDGHHRYLAEAELDEPVRAWIGTVAEDHGPWESMHDYQYGTGGRGDAPANRTQDYAALTRRVMTDGYVPVETAGRR